MDRIVSFLGYGKKPVPIGLILNIKHSEEGKPARFKARLVARGNLQLRHDRSPKNFYAAVISFDLVRLLVIISAAFH